ncbi:hypothetical protein LTR17_009627 [Elasticomyces elasticus]|nr:hypothetical protein LTR17_009627 [Elasticomyces elasticus]
MAFAKACVLAFGHALDSHQNPKVQLTLAASILAWALFALFSSAFQCGLPEPWVYTPWRCHHGGLVIMINLSIITANLPALKRFLNDLKTGQTTTRLPDGQYELSKNPWVDSGDPSGLHKNGSNHDHVVNNQSRQQEEEMHSETGSETGILRVVDIAITSEKL